MAVSLCNFACALVYGKGDIFLVIVQLLDFELSVHQTVVSEGDLLGLSPSNCHLFKIELFIAQVYEWKLSDSTNLENSLYDFFFFLKREDDGLDDHLGFQWGK